MLACYVVLKKVIDDLKELTDDLALSLASSLVACDIFLRHQT